MRFTVQNNGPMEPIVQLSLVQREWGVELIGLSQKGMRFVIGTFEPDGVLKLVGGLPKDVGLQLTASGRLVVE